MKNKKAFITLLSSKDYWMSTVILNESLKKTNSKYNLIVAVTEDILDTEIITNKTLYIDTNNKVASYDEDKAYAFHKTGQHTFSSKTRKSCVSFIFF